MKQTKKSISSLMSELRSLIDQGFRFELTQQDINKSVSDWFDKTFLTESGNKRYPDYTRMALNAFWSEFINVRMSENALFCYVVDGKLYTTFNKHLPHKYTFKGTTSIKNYKEDPSVEEKILSRKGNITDGYYYPNGKPYFVRTVI